MEVVWFTQLRASHDAVSKICEDEMDRLVEFFNEDHQQHIVPRLGKETSGMGNIIHKKVAAHIEDSRLSFSELVKETVEKLGKGGDLITLASARILVLEIGLRVCFGISNSDADPLEDTSTASLRRWEVRELKLLPPGRREEVSELRRRRRKIMDRLASLNTAVELLRALNENDISDIYAVEKAKEILVSTEDEAALRADKIVWLSKKKVARVHAQVPDVSSADSTNVTQESIKKRRKFDPQEREKLMERQRIQEEKETNSRQREEAEKEFKRKEEEVEKKRQAKEAEKEKRRREEEEVERKKQEKDAEKEQRKKEGEEAEKKNRLHSRSKLALWTGFSKVERSKKSQ